MMRKIRHNRQLFDMPDDSPVEVKTEFDSIMDAIVHINNLAMAEGLSTLRQGCQAIDYLAQRQGITYDQAMMLALLVEECSGSNRQDLSDLAKTLHCTNVEVMLYKPAVDELVQQGLIRESRWHDASISYTLPADLMDSIAADKPYERPSCVCKDGMEFFAQVFRITHERHEQDMSTKLVLSELQRLVDANPHLEYVKALVQLELSPEDRMMVMHMCRHLVLGHVRDIPMSHLRFLIDDEMEKCVFARMMAEGEHALITSGLVAPTCDNGMDSGDSFRLTDSAIHRLLGDFKVNERRISEVIASSDIIAKPLFFSDDVQRQIDNLSDLVSEQHFAEICERLKEKGLRQGFACLFYGAPGTGKTETALQLARATGRDIMRVDFATLKSKWVGDSEKNVKAVFDTYRSVCAQSERVPILLFNEADAIIGKRTEHIEHAVDKMENSIQNIILQEMESLEGIMIATTNLEQNLDRAFERRFLYKVRFVKPGPEERCHIWRSMLPQLSDDEALALAAQYDFSGGQIENIARKCNIDSVLYGDQAITPARIGTYCADETLQRSAARLGFV